MAISRAQKEQLLSEAKARFAAGDFHAAARRYKQLADAEPRSPAILFQLGKSESLSGDHQSAIRHLRGALKARPGEPAFLAQLAICQRQAGRFEEALETSQRAIEADPNHAFANGSRADLLRLAGRYEEAHALLRPLATPDADATLLTIYAMLARRFEGLERSIEVLQGVAQREDLSPSMRAQTLFQLAQALDRAGRCDEAFEAAREANTIRRPSSFDGARLERRVDEMIDWWTPERLGELPRAGVEDESPVFIVGMMRSGSTLCEQILSSHPEVHPGGELEIMRDIHENLLGHHDGDIAGALEAGALNEKSLTRSGRSYLQKRRKVTGVESARVTDKMPYNWRFLGLISLLFPKARVIHTERDPLDTCLSCYFHDFTGNHPYAYDLADLGAHYRQANRLIEHWKRVLDLPIYTLRYEDLVADQERVTRELVEFVGLEWDEACLRFHENRRVAVTHSNEQVREKLFSSSVGRHRSYEPYLEPLREALAG